MQSWEPVNFEEVINLVEGIELDKSSNVELIQTRFLKDCLRCQPDRVMNLFNLILDTSKFPDQWKIACIIPLHKGGCKKSVNDYRPISLLPIMGKLLEKVLHRRLYCFLAETEFFAKEQCGFGPNLATEDAITNLLKYFYSNINNKNLILSIYFDLSKAFDTIDHSILLLKLKHFGITGSCLKLLNNYLSYRMQYCMVNGISSSKRDIVCGVPQGSTLGPLLFIIYINDLVKYIPEINMSLYADDTVFYWGVKILTIFPRN